MTRTASNCYYLPHATTALLASPSVGKLTLVPTPDDGATPFSLLDNFDRTLARSGRLLLATGACLELLTSEGQLLSQPAKRKAGFVADFADGPVKQALADLSRLRCLSAIGSGHMQRALLTLSDDDQKIHCRAHLRILTLAAGGSVVLVALQGLIGNVKALVALRRHVEACGGILLASGGLYAHLFPGLVAYDAKPKINVAAGDPAFDTANAIISAYIPVARANEIGVIADDDTEFLHDYRIALRKVRSVLSLFADVYEEDQTARLKARFAAIMAPTGRLRDLDVYLLQKQPFYDLVPPTLHGGLDKLFGLFAAERKAEMAKLSRHLQSKSYLLEITALAKLFDKRKRLEPGLNADIGAHDFACALIWKRYRKIGKIAGSIGPDSDDADLHALRVHCKKLRYLMEFFGPLFPKRAFKSLLKPLKQLQDDLGVVNDCAVQQVSLGGFLEKLSKRLGGADHEIAQSTGALIGVLHGRQRSAREKMIESFSQFNSPASQTTFHELFHARRDRNRGTKT